MDKKLKKIAKSMSEKVFNEIYDSSFMSHEDAINIESTIKKSMKQATKKIAKFVEKQQKENKADISQDAVSVVSEVPIQVPDNTEPMSQRRTFSIGNTNTINPKDVALDEVVIKVDKLLGYIKDSLKLDALEGGGVDNWSYYSEALHGDYDPSSQSEREQYEDIDDYYEAKALAEIEEIVSESQQGIEEDR